MNTPQIEKALAKIRAIFEETSERIDALKPGERLPLTNFAATIAAKYGVAATSLYPTLQFLTKDYPNTKMHNGMKGGLERFEPSADTNKTAVEEGER